MSDTGIVRTAFDEVQQKMGVELMDWEGWYWPNHFGDAVVEHNTVREHVGVWDESPLRKWDFNGPDALAAADRIFTNDMLGLEIGQVRYAPFCDENGNMVGDGTVFKFTDTSCWVITALDSDFDHFQDVVDGMQVEIEPITEKLPHLQIQGPKSRELLADLTDESVEDLGYFRFFPHQVHVGRVPVWISRTGYSGELGFEVFTDPDYAEELWAAVTGAGARPYGLAAVETLRIESGLIFIGFDYFPGVTSPFHVNLDRMIKLDKGDFYGKEALQAELDAGITHRMVTLVIAGEDAPDYNTPVLSNGRGVGKLTSPSAGRSPTVDKLIAMACIEADLAEVGRQVEVTLPDGRLVPALVDQFPIYDPEKSRPRS